MEVLYLALEMIIRIIQNKVLLCFCTISLLSVSFGAFSNEVCENNIRMYYNSFDKLLSSTVCKEARVDFHVDTVSNLVRYNLKEHLRGSLEKEIDIENISFDAKLSCLQITQLAQKLKNSGIFTVNTDEASEIKYGWGVYFKFNDEELSLKVPSDDQRLDYIKDIILSIIFEQYKNALDIKTHKLKIEGDSVNPQAVDLIKIVEERDSYHGKRIITFGFYSDNYLYIDKAGADKKIKHSALYIDSPSYFLKDKNHKKRIAPGWICAEGVLVSRNAALPVLPPAKLILITKIFALNNGNCSPSQN